MELEKLIENIGELNPNRNYWLVRTDSGQFYDVFKEGNYIGIGWNKITIENLSRLNITAIKEKIAKEYNYDLESSYGKSKCTQIYNKLNRFRELKKGDVVIIPSRASFRLAFGIIEDDVVYSDIDNRDQCPYYKRRKINWITEKTITDLDPIFYLVKQSRHAISSIQKYHNAIDNILNNLYIKEGYGHYVLDITTTDEINVNSLLGLVDGVQALLDKLNKHFELGEDITSSSIKLNLQSPGKIEFKLKHGKALVYLAVVLSLSACSSSQGSNTDQVENEKVKTFMEIEKDVIDHTNKTMEELKVKIDKINANR